MNQPNLLVFCYEAGNSGGNLLDPDQPTYLIAGWAMEPDRQQAIEEAVERYASQIGQSGGELKGSSLLRRSKPQALYGEFIRSVSEAGAWPVYAIFEKRFWIAGRIVEALFDYVHNNQSSLEFFSNFQAKRDTAWHIADWPLKDLAAFATALRQRDATGMRDAVHRLRLLADQEDDPQMKRLFAGAQQNFEAIWQAEFSAELDHGLDTVNVPAFNAFLSVLDTMASHSSEVRMRLIHDRSREFEGFYRTMFEMLTNMGDFVWPDADGNYRFMNVRVVHTFETQDSEQSPLLQAADLLANGLFRYTKAIARGEPVPPWLGEALAPTLAFSVTADIDPAPGRLMGTQNFLMDCYLSVVQNLSFQGSDTTSGA